MQPEAAERAKTCGGAARRDSDTRFDPRVAAPRIAIHAARLAIGWTGVSPVALAVAAGLFVVRAFGLTAGHHRDSDTARASRLASCSRGSQFGGIEDFGHELAARFVSPLCSAQLPSRGLDLPDRFPYSPKARRSAEA